MSEQENVAQRVELGYANDLLQAMVGSEFLTCLVSGTVQMHLYSDGGDCYYLQLGTSFHLDGPEGWSLVDSADDPSSASVLLPLLRQAAVSSVNVTAPANLRVDFNTGHSVRADCHQSYEAWDINLPGGAMLVALPGGGVAQWIDPT